MLLSLSTNDYSYWRTGHIFTKILNKKLRDTEVNLVLFFVSTFHMKEITSRKS